MENHIVIAILILCIGGAAWYVIRAKKRGKKCIGCPDCGSCSSKKEGGCCCNAEEKK